MSTNEMERPPLDLSRELAELLQYVATAAIAIRMHSAYRRQGREPEAPEAQFDLLWLSDSLHNFDYLGRAIARGTPEMLIDACNHLIAAYERYAKDGSGFDSRAAFERAKRYGVDLSQAANALRAIRAKAMAAIDTM